MGLFTKTKELLSATTLGDCLRSDTTLALGGLAARPKPAEVITVTTKTTIAEALKTLAAANILSAPVITTDGSNEYTGIIDVVDILSGLVGTTGLPVAYSELLDANGQWLSHHPRLGMNELTSFGVDFGQKTIENLIHAGELWHKGDCNSNVLQVIKDGFLISIPPRVHVSTPNQQHRRVHHRVTVFEILPGEQTPDGPIPEWRVVHVFSQSDVVRLLAGNADKLASEDKGMEASLKELGLVDMNKKEGGVVTVDAAAPALAALVAMHHKNVSGVGVVAGRESQKLLGNLSVSDLRGVSSERFGALALPLGAFLLLQRGKINWEDAVVGHFLPAVKEGRWEEALAEVKESLITCSPGTSLKEVLKTMAEDGKHRVYVVDGDGKAVAVVTPTDVLKLVVAEESA